MIDGLTGQTVQGLIMTDDYHGHTHAYDENGVCK